MTSVMAADVEASIVLLLQRLVGDVLHAPVGLMKMTVCLMVSLDGPIDEGVAF